MFTFGTILTISSKYWRLTKEEILLLVSLSQLGDDLSIFVIFLVTFLYIYIFFTIYKIVVYVSKWILKYILKKLITMVIERLVAAILTWE